MFYGNELASALLDALVHDTKAAACNPVSHGSPSTREGGRTTEFLENLIVVGHRSSPDARGTRRQLMRCGRREAGECSVAD